VSAEKNASEITTMNFNGLPADVDEVFRAVIDPNWYPVYAFENADGQSSQWERDAPSPKKVAPTRIPKGTRIVLVVADPQNYRPAQQLISGYAKITQNIPPIVVLLLGARLGPPSESRRKAILGAQAALQEVGADDVCVGLGDVGKDDIGLILDMGEMRARNKSEYERQLIHQEERIQNLQQSLWKQVRTQIPDFPPMQFDSVEELEPGSAIGPWKLHQVVGCGRVGTVYAARNHDLGRNEAIKTIPKAEIDTVKEVKEIIREVNLLGKLDHKNVVHLYGFTHTHNYLLIHMELAGSRNLFRHMVEAGGRLPLEPGRKLASQMVQALAHCHERGVVHCDVKPENVIVSKDGQCAKLVDFGFSVEVGTICKEIKGTMPFLAPEIFSCNYDATPVDVWALGVLILEVLCGLGKLNRMMRWEKDMAPDHRLQGTLNRFFSQPDVVRQALEADEVPPSFHLTTVLRGALEPAPAKRWTAQQLTRSEWLLDDASVSSCSSSSG
jgi:hypothetical protein